MKPTYSRPIIWICSLIMTALGFAGCSDDEDTIVADEYVTPYADYKYMGTVTDENGKPIEGINVVFQKHGYKNYPELFRIETDKSGKYETDYLDWTMGANAAYQVLYTDIDGEENGGHFEDKILEIHKMDKTKIKDGEHWYQGMFDLSAEVKLSRKSTQQEQDNKEE